MSTLPGVGFKMRVGRCILQVALEASIFVFSESEDRTKGICSITTLWTPQRNS